MKTTGTIVSVLSALALAAAPALPGGPTVEAQDVRYTSVSEVELGGPLGRVVGALPGVDREVRETVWISGARMRTDTEGESTIVDLEAGWFAALDHATETFWRMDFADFAGSVRELGERMDEASVEAEDARREAEAGSDEAVRRLEIDLSTDRTGERREIAGFDTERVFVTLEMKSEELQVADDPENPEMRQGKTVMLTELWLTDEELVTVPEELEVEGWRELSGGAMEDWAAMDQVFAGDPQLQVAFDRSQAALDDLTGTAVESTVFWVLVPPEKAFDRQMALADRDRSLGDDVAAAAAERAKESAEESVKKGLGRIGGLFGGDDEEEEEEAAPELTQQTFMRIRTAIEEIERGPVPPSTFEIPAGYTERELAVPSGGQRR